MGSRRVARQENSFDFLDFLFFPTFSHSLEKKIFNDIILERIFSDICSFAEGEYFQR